MVNFAKDGMTAYEFIVDSTIPLVSTRQATVFGNEYEIILFPDLVCTSTALTSKCLLCDPYSGSGKYEVDVVLSPHTQDQRYMCREVHVSLGGTQAGGAQADSTQAGSTAQKRRRHKTRKNMKISTTAAAKTRMNRVYRQQLDPVVVPNAPVPNLASIQQRAEAAFAAHRPASLSVIRQHVIA